MFSYHSFVVLGLLFFFSHSLFPTMSFNANGVNVDPALPSSEDEKILLVADATVASATRVAGIDIDREVPN